MMTWALASLTSLLPHVVWLQWIYKHAQLGMDLVAHVIMLEIIFHNNTKSKCVCVTAGTVLVD